MSSKRFPFPIPYGWYHIDFAEQLQSESVHILKRFARELILWKTSNGSTTLQDAHCPICGVHMGFGGKVIDNNLVCPKITCTFYAGSKESEKSTFSNLFHTYPVVDRHGILMGWYHPKNAPPLYELPTVTEFENPNFVKPISRGHTIKTCLQEMGENAADSAHFSTVHGHLAGAEYKTFKLDRQEMYMESSQVFPSSGGPVIGTISSRSIGFGWAEVRYKTLIEVCMLTTNAPLDEENVIQYFHVSYLNKQKDARVDRIGIAFVKEVNRQFTDDITIWEHKVYRPNPILCDGDGPIALYRKWAEQFYLYDR